MHRHQSNRQMKKVEADGPWVSIYVGPYNVGKNAWSFLWLPFCLFFISFPSFLSKIQRTFKKDTAWKYTFLFFLFFFPGVFFSIFPYVSLQSHHFHLDLLHLFRVFWDSTERRRWAALWSDFCFQTAEGKQISPPLCPLWLQNTS